MANHSTEYYQCSKCDATFELRPDLHKHVKEAHGESRPKCEECGTTYIDESGYQRHQKLYHGSFPCSYPKCNFKLDTLESLNKHMKKHQNLPKYTCTICGREHHSAKNLQLHMESVHDDHSCRCTVEGCGAEFDHPCALRRHVVSFHVKEFDAENTCKICGRCFKGQKANLTRHMNSVHWLEQFKAKFGKAREDGENEEDLENFIAPTKLSTLSPAVIYGRRS
ncbi:98c07550-ea98-4163-96c6-2043f0303299 [Sclerotinia trifoliorum]|uniref:98c07550-ea98-4163-96c6-2043f0303299 n=1 Tax=Sclerotinia trifoliorum TaxID=28548 RepID=A0A8H2ZTI5_9HELO|nr:98c07550-ea98-4163-96c6-2043f0303299 [Sclerotinia trifoliorum]